MTIRDYKKNKGSRVNNDKIIYLKGLMYRTIITTIIVMGVLILCNYSSKVKSFINKHLFETDFNFSYLNQLYDKIMINFKGNKDETIVPVGNMNETDKITEYFDGAVIEFEGEREVKLHESGIVVFIGEKESYGNTVIVQQSNGIDAWYGNITSEIKLYDYIEKGTVVGKTTDKYYMVFQKNGEFIDYKEIIK